jgi:hypothetical protein
MLSWFLKLLGVSSEITEHLADASFALQRPAVLWTGIVLLAPAAYFIYRRQQTNLITAPLVVRRVLTACRIAVVAMMVLVLASPYVKIDHKIENRPIVAVLLDQSQSMNLPAGPFETEDAIAGAARAAGYATASAGVDAETRRALNQITRAKLAATALEAARDSFATPIAEKFDLRFYGVGEELKALAIDLAQSKIPEPPNPGGRISPLGQAVSEVLEQAAGRPVAGIVLLSDGQNTGAVSLSQAALAASRLGTPIFPVPTGSVTRLRDVAIVDVYTSGLVSAGDTASVSVTIESQGFDGRPVKLQLLEGEKSLDSKDLTLRGTEQQHMELTFEAKVPGAHYLTVQVTPLEDETIRENNSDVAFLRVDDQKIKVLYVEGMPRWDFRFIKNGMRRDHGVDGTLILESESRLRAMEAGAKVPATAEDWAAYRTVILGDCSTELLGRQAIEPLSDAVRDKGLGLIVLAGPSHMPHAFEGTALVDLLPVRVRRGLAGYDAAGYNPFKMELTPAGATHDALRLYDEPGRNASVWSNMPPYYWCAAVMRPAPGATVLATNPSIEDRFGKMPLIAYHYAGKGRVMFVGTDSTWLWRQNVGDRFFYKFWGQTVRFVASHDEKAGQKSWIEVRPLRVQPGEQAEIELMAFAADGTPRTDPKLIVSITRAGESQALSLDAAPTTKGRYTGRFTPKAEGIHKIQFDPGGGQDPVEAEIRVSIAPEELRRPNLDRPALELLASHSGGQLIELADLGKIPEKLKGEPKLIELHREETIWDNWFTLSLLVLVYSVDVGIRRLLGLS